MSDVTRQILDSYDFADVRSRYRYILKKIWFFSCKLHIIQDFSSIAFSLFALRTRLSTEDLEHLNEDGELWFAYEGLKKATRLALLSIIY